MKTIRISDEVWDEIAKRGKFGETEDDVLRRIFGISKGQIKPTPNPFRSRIRKAEIRMSSNVVGNKLVVEFENGISKSWELPDSNGTAKIRQVRDSAVNFAIQNKASFGQQNAVKKALTDAGYYVSR